MQVCKYASMQVCKHASMQICKYASMQVCKYTSVQVCKFAGMQVCKYAGMQVRKYASAQVCKYAEMQVCKYASMQMQVYSITNKLSWECHTRDLRFKMKDNPQTPCINCQDTPRLRVEYIQQEKSIWWVGGWFFQEIIPLRGSILQAETCKILSLAENPRWSRVWQYALACYLPENSLRTSKNFQKPFRLLPETLKTPQRICLGTSQYSNMLAPGGWVGGLVSPSPLHNNTTLWHLQVEDLQELK